MTVELMTMELMIMELMILELTTMELMTMELMLLLERPLPFLHRRRHPPNFLMILPS